ncbi:MAG: thiamine pyrophosphate-dependent enzyme [Candidatus Binatia bacterium]
MDPQASGLKKVFEKTSLLLTAEHSLCPGCGEPLAIRTILEVIQELGRRGDTICVCGIGCYTAFPNMMDVDVIQAIHGRAPSVATGAKRMLPGSLVWTLQGDGDMVSEGLQEVVHTAARGERVTCILLNNGVFGETGGHMTATTVPGQKTKTTPGGRDVAVHGSPIRISELVASLDGSSYVARGAMSTPAAIAWTRRILTEAFEDQIAGNGFSLVEILTMCPTDWYVEPKEGPRWLEENLAAYYPQKILKGRGAEA